MAESPTTIENGKRKHVPGMEENNMEFLLEAMKECDDGSLRFSENKFQNLSHADGEDSDTECVLEDLEEDEHMETVNGVGSPEETEEAENPENPEESDHLEHSGKESKDGLINRSCFEDLCPDPCDDSQWYSLLKEKDLNKVCLADFDNIRFKSVEEAEKFYYYYAFMVGFSTRRGINDTTWINGVEVTTARSWTCSKEGFTKPKKKVNENVVLGAENNVGLDADEEHVETEDVTAGADEIGLKGGHHVKGKKLKKQLLKGQLYSRTNCKARFRILLIRKTTLYKVSVFNTSHNHGFAAANEKHFLRSFRKVTKEDILEVEALRTANVNIGGAFDFFVHQNGGSAFVGFTSKDLYNALDAQKRKTKNGDAEAAINWLQIRGREEEKFFCRYIRDKGGRLAGLFWRDTQSLMDYELYGDIVAIDSTYKTNVYGMPLVLFVGANNHRASVVFACALVVNEREPLFNWVIMKFLEAMKHRKPKSVVTDGDDMLRKVLERHMSDTKHRLCAWHIGRNVGQNVKEPKLAKALGKMIYASYSITEWEDEWKSLITEHKVENNTWIISLYNKRQKWAEAYSRGQWYGGMCTTQRCEGMNNKFKLRIGKYTTLTSFVPMFQRGLERLRDRVLLDNFKSKNLTRRYETHLLPIEDFTFKTFTDDIFLVIRGQMHFEKKFSVTGRYPDWESRDILFHVKQYDKPLRCWAVQYIARSSEKEDDESYSCSCQLFESEGIPCPHIFCVFKCEGVKEYPKSLICERWMKCQANVAVGTVCSEDKDIGFKPSRFVALLGVARRVCMNLSNSPEGFELGLSSLNKMEERSLQFRVAKNPKLTPAVSENVILDPLIPRKKGTQRNSETGDPIKVSEGHKCSKCIMPGHNILRCPLNDQCGKDKSVKSLSQRSFGEKDVSSRGGVDGRTRTVTTDDDNFDLPDLNSQVSESGEPIL